MLLVIRAVINMKLGNGKEAYYGGKSPSFSCLKECCTAEIVGSVFPSIAEGKAGINCTPKKTSNLHSVHLAVLNTDACNETVMVT